MMHLDTVKRATNAAWFTQFRARVQPNRHLYPVNRRVIGRKGIAPFIPIPVEIEGDVAVRLVCFRFDSNRDVSTKPAKDPLDGDSVLGGQRASQ